MLGRVAMSVEIENNSDVVEKEERFVKCTSKKKTENCGGKPSETVSVKSETTSDMTDMTDVKLDLLKSCKSESEVQASPSKTVGFLSDSNTSNSSSGEIQTSGKESTSAQKGTGDEARKQSKKQRHHSHSASQHGNQKPLAFAKRRRKTIDRNPQPKFLMGGTITDPLNLNSLADEEVSKVVNAVTPMSSPLPHLNKDPDPVIVPADIRDPLKLNSEGDDDNANLTRTLGSRSGKKRRKGGKVDKKEDGSDVTSPTEEMPEITSLKSPTSAIDPARLQSLQLSNHPKVIDKIVSPVLPDSLSKSRKRKHKQEPSSKISRALLIENDEEVPVSDSIHKHHRTASPEKRKYKRQHSKEGKTLPKFHEENKKFQYGNYNRYYGYRNPDKDDPRLPYLKKEWFAGKSCLDIGCNTGHVTLYIAKEFLPQKIVGIDIDGNLIGVARKNIKHCLMDKAKSQSVGETSGQKFPLSMEKSFGPISKAAVPGVEGPNFPSNVLFRCANFVLASDSLLQAQKPEYDVILCLSVTKWVHLNWGDAGIKRFFRRIFLALKPGGYFILEPQAWPSYKKKKKLTETVFKNYQEIQFMPDQFKSFLLSKEVGFSSCETIGVPLNQSKGFRRPMLMFTKLIPEKRYHHHTTEASATRHRVVKSPEGKPPGHHQSVSRSHSREDMETTTTALDRTSGTREESRHVHQHHQKVTTGQEEENVLKCEVNLKSDSQQTGVRQEKETRHYDEKKDSRHFKGEDEEVKDCKERGKETESIEEVKGVHVRDSGSKEKVTQDNKGKDRETRDIRGKVRSASFSESQDQEPACKKPKLPSSHNGNKVINNPQSGQEFRTHAVNNPLSGGKESYPAAKAEALTSVVALPASCSSESKSTDMQHARYKVSVTDSPDRTG